jgi:DNA recombination protein RmuC
MQQLASDVGGLQAGADQCENARRLGRSAAGDAARTLLTPEQFDRNVQTRDESGERVDYAIKLPAKVMGAAVWLPIDAKFPMEDYQRLITAQESGDSMLTDSAMKDLETQLRKIGERYLREIY